jgi:RNase P subunit RPR2
MDEPHVTLCPDCCAPLTPAVAISRLVERRDIRILKCDRCIRFHWFVLKDGALLKM